MAQPEEFMLQSVAYRPTVYRTGVIPESRVHSDLSYTQSGRILLDALHVGSVDIFSSQRKDRAPK